MCHFVLLIHPPKIYCPRYWGTRSEGWGICAKDNKTFVLCRPCHPVMGRDVTNRNRVFSTALEVFVDNKTNLFWNKPVIQYISTSYLCTWSVNFGHKRSVYMVRGVLKFVFAQISSKSRNQQQIISCTQMYRPLVKYDVIGNFWI